MKIIDYYLPINVANLSTYLSSAIITPRKYTKSSDDVQSRFIDSLLLSKTIGVEDSNVCLCVAITEEENDKLEKINGNLSLFYGTLPISRIKNILFSTKEQMAHTISSIDISTAFIQKELFSYQPFSNEVVPDYKIKKINIPDLTKKIKAYDRFLGAISLLRLGKEKNEDFSDTYFSTLSFFNKKIKDEYENNSGQQINTKYHDIFIGNKEFKEILTYLNKNIEKDDLEKISIINNQTIKRDRITDDIDFSNLKGMALIIAILSFYGTANEAKRKTIDTLIINNFEIENHSDKKEVIALCYGYNRGYSIFSKEIKGQRIKFKMNSKLDYYLIESIFQYVFNNKLSDELDYLDSYCPSLSEQVKSSNDYKVLDVIVKGPNVISEKYYLILSNWFKGFTFKEIMTDFDKLIKDLIKKIYKDTNAEAKRIINKKDVEIEKHIQKTDQLRKEILKLKENKNKKYISQSNIHSVNEMEINYNSKLKEEIAKEVLRLKNMGAKDFKNELENLTGSRPQGNDEDIRDNCIIEIIKDKPKEINY